MAILEHLFGALAARGLLTAVEAIVAGLGTGAAVWLIRRIQIALGIKDAREEKYAAASSHR